MDASKPDVSSNGGGMSAGEEHRSGEMAGPEAAPALERRTPAVHRSTLQILPGRLVPEAGLGIRQEIRFMRSSEAGHEVTLGRERGTPPDHVTVQHPSVERRHGAMRFRRGHWWIRSLSGTRPVILNGTPLDSRDGPRHLKDGDMVRLGEVSFRFRMP